MKTKGSISKKVEKKVREYFEKLNNDIKPITKRVGRDSNITPTNK